MKTLIREITKAERIERRKKDLKRTYEQLIQDGLTPSDILAIIQKF